MAKQSMHSSPIQRVGVIGGGQLAWMMAGAAPSLGLTLVVQTPHSTDPAIAVSGRSEPQWKLATDFILAPISDATATAKLAARCDVVTFENEFVNLEALGSLAQSGVDFQPRIEVLVPLLDKYHQRCYLQELGLSVPKFIALDNAEEIAQLTTFGFPAVLKARRHGYDGQGTFILKDQGELEAVQQKLVQRSLLLEEYIPFTRELAVVAARSGSGEIAVFPIVETQQEDQVCRRVIAPADLREGIATKIEAIARTLLSALDAVGVFGIELFLTADEQIFVNEVAPRTHNSGHFTLDACNTSQFEQHLRAVAQLPLGDPALHCDGAIMVNLLGYETSTQDYRDKRQRIAAIPQAHLYWYGKSQARPGRKLGHVTVLVNAQSPSQCRSQGLAIAKTIENIWYDSGS